MENIKAENDALISSYRLNTLCHGTGQEIDSLSHQICLTDSTIADLEARLGKYEGTCKKVETEEPVILGHSKRSLESLCNEARNLKQILPDRPTETHAAQQSKTNKFEIDRLQQHAWETEWEISGIAGRQQLQREFRRGTHGGQWTSKDEQDRFYSSLEENQLRAQLAATIAVCQELLMRLERNGSPDKGTHDLQFQEFTDSSKAANLNTVVCKLKEENRELKQRIAYVENLNSKWQKYDLSREEYVKGLCKRLKESNPLADLGAGLGAGAGPVLVRSTLLQQEIVRLNRLLDEKMNDCTKLSRELEDSRKQDQERIQTLEQQVLIYTDDFKSERADRERAQSRVQDLQEEVLRLQQKLCKKQQERRDPPAACCVHIGHRMSAHVQADGAEPRVQPGPQRSSRQPATVRTDRQALTDLQCPRCFASYDEEHTAEFLKHWDMCANL
ncbi:TNFAIP3-interacting protein 2 isoform X1 [Anguilla anguilla]|uniref:TNFAIP3-interacting protein 2 isoform X1 n=1 Tax=Anguilla anguilla TaxID=7936 RepID=UPI0015B17295|nr:TNFAIP3-interacting protein 2 isoform X1 [Anguilla anguilla]